jgi:hypothetical protein
MRVMTTVEAIPTARRYGVKSTIAPETGMRNADSNPEINWMLAFRLEG